MLITGEPWTAGETDALCRMWRGMTVVAISQELPGRTPASVSNRAHFLRLPPKHDMQPWQWLPHQISQARAMWVNGDSLAAIADVFGCPSSTIGRLRDSEGWPPRERSKWPAAVKARLKSLWDEGMSVRAIARELGVTKNAVVGTVHRMCLPGRASPIIRAAAPRTPPAPRLPSLPLPSLPSLLASAVVSAPPAASVVRPAPRPVLVETFGPPVAPRVFSQCLWPVGEPGTRGFRYCDADVMDRGPYCAEHRKGAFAKTAQPYVREAA